jgi:endoglucanase
MRTKFVDKGVPVLVGEFGAMKRIEYADLTGTELQRHLASRTYFNKQIVDTANLKGLKPVYWDNGWNGKDGFQLFDHATGAVTDADSVRSLTGGVALTPP